LTSDFLFSLFFLGGLDGMETGGLSFFISLDLLSFEGSGFSSLGCFSGLSLFLPNNFFFSL
jgi:hypothetical protein